MALVSDVVFSLLLVATGLLSVSTIGFGIAWIRARERAIRAEQRMAHAPDAGEARVDRLEHVVAAIAGDVEQLAEGQQFVSRLLGESVGPVHAAGAPSVHATAPR